MAITFCEFRLYNLAGSSFTLLPGFTSASFDVKYNDLGALSLSYPLADAVAAGLGDNSYIGVNVGYADGTSEEVERYVVNGTSDDKVVDGVKQRTLTARSSLAFLDDAKVYPSNWPVTSPTGHEFVAQSIGSIFRTLIDRVQARGGLTNLIETTFSGPTDSNGVAWAQLQDQNFATGTSYLNIMQDQMQLGLVDAYMEGWTLKLLNGGTRGNHVGIGTVLLSPANNLTEMTINTDTSESASTVLVEGEEGSAVERHSSSAQTLLGRRIERYAAHGGITDSGVLTILGDAELAIYGKIPTEETAGVALVTNFTPFQQFDVGDWVYVQYAGTDVPAERRVRQIAIGIDQDRKITAGVTLNSIIYEQDIKLQRKIDAYAGNGSSYGAAPNSGVDNTTPNPPAGLLLSSATFVDTAGQYAAAVSASWTAPTTNVDGSPLNDLEGYEVHWRYVGDTNWSNNLPTDASPFQWSPVQPGRQIEVQVRSKDSSAHLSSWFPTTPATHTVAVDTTAPSQPSTPTTSAKIGAITVTWDGLASGGPMETDVARVEVWRSNTSGFVPQDVTSSLAGSLVRGGDTATLYGPYGTTIYVKLVAVDYANNRSAASSQGSATPLKITGTDITGGTAIPSDGLSPTAAPANVTATGGIGAIFVKWDAITNLDPVQYEVHISKNANFTADYAGGGTGPEFFESFSGTLARWPGAYGSPSISSGHVNLVSSAGNFMGIATGQTFTMSNKAVSAQITPQATPGATQQVIFKMQADENNQFVMFKSASNTSITTRARVNGTNNDAAFSVTTGQVYWQISESAGDVSFLVSTNGTSWTTLRTLAAHGMDTTVIQSMIIDISCGDTNSGSVLTPLTTQVDNVSYGSETLSKTLVEVTDGTTSTIRALPNNVALQYNGQPYFLKVVAKDADGYGPFSSEASAMLVQVNTPDIAASYIYAGTIYVDQLRGGTLTADVIMGATIRTAESGERAEMGPFGFVTYDSNNAPTVVLPSDADVAASFKGDVEAAGLTVIGKAAFRATNNEIVPGGGLILQSSVTAPQSPPSVVVDWPSVPLGAGGGAPIGGYYGLFYISSKFQVTTSKVGQYQIKEYNTDGTYSQTLKTYTVTFHPENWTFSSAFKVGTTHWVMALDIGNNWAYVQRKTDAGVETQVFYNRINNNRIPILGYDGTSLLVAEWDEPNDRFRFQTMDMTSLAITGTTYTTTNSGFTGPLYGVIKGSFDLGASRWIVAALNGVHCWVFDSSGTYIPNESFPVKTIGTKGVAYDGTRFWTLVSTGTLTKHAPAAWNNAVDPQTWWASDTWYDSDATGGTHETDMSPVKSFSMRRRAWLTLTSATIPDSGGTDDPDRPRFYVGNVNATRTNLWKQTDPSAGVKSLTYETVTLGSGTNPPASNNFPSATPGWIKSGDLLKTQLYGDGEGYLQDVKIGQFVRKPSDETVTNTTTLQNDDHLLFTARNNAIYHVLVGVHVTTNNNLNDIRLGLSVPSGSWDMIKVGPSANLTTGTTTFAGDWASLRGAVSNSLVYGTADGTAPVLQIGFLAQFVAVIGVTGGTVTLQWAQGTAGAGLSATIKGNSFIWAVRVLDN